MHRGICTNRDITLKFIFARIMPSFGIKIFCEKAATAKGWSPHAVLCSLIAAAFLKKVLLLRSVY